MHILIVAPTIEKARQWVDKNVPPEKIRFRDRKFMHGVVDHDSWKLASCPMDMCGSANDEAILIGPVSDEMMMLVKESQSLSTYKIIRREEL